MKQVKSTAISVFALALAFMWLAPLVWLVGTAFSEPTFHMTFFPNSRFTFGNLSYVWNAIPFARYYLNTLILVVVTFCVQFVTSTLAAYALAVMDFKGRTLVFAVIFMQIIIPNDVLITPNFMTLADMGLTDTKVGIMLPFFGSALAIFLLRQHFKSIPKALAEAARIDGANAFQIYWRIFMPIMKPQLILVGVLNMITVWNDYLGPLIFLQDRSKFTLALGLASFKGVHSTKIIPMLCITVIMILPPIIVFLFAQKHIVEGTSGAIK